MKPDIHIYSLCGLSKNLVGAPHIHIFLMVQLHKVIYIERDGEFGAACSTVQRYLI